MPYNKVMESNTRTISLVVTEKCNLNCVYCYEKYKTPRNMSFETAKKAIDKELKPSKTENVYIDFFGGEPFCNFELIRQVYDYIMSFYQGKIRFFATTNGTLVHGGIQKWLTERKDFFTVGLSLDGLKIAHDLNRSNSYDKIDIDFFLKNYPEQPVKMTISEQTLSYFADGIIEMQRMGFRVECNLAYMVNWTNEKNKGILEEQLNRLIDFYLENPTVPRCQMFDFKINALARPMEKKGFIRKYCGTGTGMVCYDIMGNAYPCQLFIPTSAGEKSVKTEELHLPQELPISLFPKNCKNCYYLRICPICFGSNYLSTGNFFTPDSNRCNLYKLIFQANAKLKALEWEKGLLSLRPDEEQALLRSIVAIQQL